MSDSFTCARLSTGVSVFVFTSMCLFLFLCLCFYCVLVRVCVFIRVCVLVRVWLCLYFLCSCPSLSSCLFYLFFYTLCNFCSCLCSCYESYYAHTCLSKCVNE